MSKYHFTGIGGVGMSALAEAALQQGHQVSGSDRLLDSGQESRVLQALCSRGAKLFPQDGSGVGMDADAVVVSTAIEADNPDLLVCRERELAVIHRSDMLGMLVEGRGRRAAVSGTCGKSTVTGLAGWLLCESGMDPSVINGAPLADWMSRHDVGSSRTGLGGVCVFEADESDKSLLNYGCELAVITNAFADHFDVKETNDLFDRFAARAETVLDARDESFYADVSIADGGFTYRSVFFDVPLPGQHNILNTVIAVKLCAEVGADISVIAQKLPDFCGVSRRLEFIGSRRGVAVYDDYAHNTEKIRAALKTLGEKNGVLTAIWRPHGYGPLKNMLDDLDAMFSDTLRDGDKLILLPVYDAGGTADRSINSDELVRRVRDAGRAAVFVEQADEARAMAVETGSDAVVILGARDPALPELARAVLASL